MRLTELHITPELEALRSNDFFVACSGGVDSICLVHLLVQNGFSIKVIHVNYQLRGKASEEDAKFVEDFCLKHKVPFHKRTIDLKKELQKGGNLQQKAREYRYAWFKEIIHLSDLNRVVLAHHANDQVETFFLNLGRKSGVMGLACMPFENNGIIRPLLKFTKVKLIEYANAHELSWREDQSNADSKYRRNLLRNRILPFLSNEVEQLEESVLILVEHFQRKQRSLELKINPIVEELKTTLSLPVELYSSLDRFEQIEFMRQLHQPASLAQECEALINSQKGKRVQLLPNPFFKEIIREKNDFSFLPLNQEAQQYNLTVEAVNDLPMVFSKEILYLDGDKIKGKLKIRPWRQGDRIDPIGMRGSKLISDIIVGANVPNSDKSNVLVVHDDMTIHWCVGYKIGRKAIASTQSSSVLRCSITSVAPE